MNIYLATAAVLAFLVGLVHSVLGEMLIFGRLRQGRLVPTNGGSLLQERHVRILWASWHVLTVFGWCIAAVLLWLSLPSSNPSSALFIEQAIVFSMLAGSALVLLGTRARHPGWVGLLAVAVFVWLGRAS
jgi:drug/metabolite transporter (DMT)-like permease